MPSDWTKGTVLELPVLDTPLWEWIGLLLVAVVAAAFSWVVVAGAVRVLRTLARRSRTELDDALAARAAAPLRLLVGLWMFSAGSRLFGVAGAFHGTIDQLVRGLTIAALAWLLMRVIDVLAGSLEQTFRERGQTAAVSVVPLGRRSLKVALGALATLALLQNLGINITGLLAGVGIGGLAIALAAQKTVENLFGGVTLITDQPVRVGDFCGVGDTVGTVEDVGLRSTRIRTLSRTVLTIPNAELAGMMIENYARRDRIWLQLSLGLRYETTADQLRHVLVALKRLLLAHPKIHPDPARVRFAGFGAYSLDVEVFAYVITTDINEFHAVREDVLLRIMDLVEASGTGFAFPSQTIYRGDDTGLHQGRARAAEEEVRRWRTEGKLPLPTVPPEVVAELDDTLDYPPEGSATRA